jgi:hypothetical protein
LPHAVSSMGAISITASRRTVAALYFLNLMMSVPPAAVVASYMPVA